MFNFSHLEHVQEPVPTDPKGKDGNTFFVLLLVTPSPLAISNWCLRRASSPKATNFAIYFRDELWGVSFEELQRRKKERKEAEALKPLLPTESDDA